MHPTSGNLEQFKTAFVVSACYQMDENLRMLNIALEKVTETQLWQKPNASLNSIANLILHLCGNMTQYGITSLKEIEDKRERDVEFSTNGGFRKIELIEKLEDTVEATKTTFKTVSLERLLQVKSVQGFEFSGIQNIMHVVEHFSYHTGQIAFWVKELTNEPLGFYDGMDLNTLNDKL